MLGPNGAGKTTTIRMITGFLPPLRAGSRSAGSDLFDDAGRRAGARSATCPRTSRSTRRCGSRSTSAYRAPPRGAGRADARAAIGEAVERCLLADVRRQIIGTLSKGYRQRVGLAAAILHGPRVLVLDEPTVGLDPKQIIAIRELIRELGRERTLLLSTHILPEVELLCHRVLIIDRGRIVGQGTPEELRERWQGHAVLRVEVEGAPPEAAAALRELPERGERAARTRAPPASFLVEGAEGADPRAPVFRLAVAARLGAARAEPRRRPRSRTCSSA